MIKISAFMIFFGILFLINATMDVGLLLRVFDLAAALWLCWNAFDRIDPPTDGGLFDNSLKA